MSDIRLKTINFQDKDCCITHDYSMSNGENEKARLSYQTLDIQLLIVGFGHLC